MTYNDHTIKSISIVLEAAQRELEQTSTYVDRIVALKNTAEMLKMLTDYRNLGDEIEYHLNFANSVTYEQINKYASDVKSLLNEKITLLDYKH